MSDTRTVQAAETAREASNLIRPEDAPILGRFVELACMTTAWNPDHLRLPFRMDPASAFSGNFAMLRRPDAPAHIIEAWSDWTREYGALLERNPPLELERMLSTISEVVDSSSWPDGYEDELRDWADRGERLPWPRTLGPWAEGEIDERFYHRLRELRAATGGWVYHDTVLVRHVFRTDAQRHDDLNFEETMMAKGHRPFAIGPSGQVRPADPVGAAAMSMRIAVGDTDEGGAIDHVTRAFLVDPDASPDQRRAAWELRRERGLDRIAEIATLWDHLHAWGEGRISYREVMNSCGIDTLEELLAAALNSAEPFGDVGREQGAIAFVERIGREHLSHDDRAIANMILIRRGIGLADLTGRRGEELIAALTPAGGSSNAGGTKRERL